MSSRIQHILCHKAFVRYIHAVRYLFWSSVYACECATPLASGRLNADVVASDAVNQLVKTVTEVETKALPAEHDPCTGPVIVASSVNLL